MRRGRLRVFLGAAPGVGKTYTMLEEGRRLAGEGHDVVAAFIETHGRAATAAMIEGLEVVPRRTEVHRGMTLEEMDVDAVLARKPEVALVDELAHTNAPDSRHPKRWQDVEDLLAAGIDVLSTVNTQHIESLGDVVLQITGVPQRETIPDSVLRSADQIEVIDLAPQALRIGWRADSSTPPSASTRLFRTTSDSATSLPCANSPSSGSPTRSTRHSRPTAPSTASGAPGRHANASSSPSPEAPRARRCSDGAPVSRRAPPAASSSRCT